MKPTFEVVRGTKTQRICEIKGADFHIGRLPNLDLFIDDDRISRQHARIQRPPDGSYDLMGLRVVSSRGSTAGKLPRTSRSRCPT